MLTCTSQHDAAAAPVDGVLGGDDSNVDGSLLPKSVIGDEILHLVQSLAEFSDELVDVVQQTNGNVLVNATGPHIGCVHPGTAGSLVELHHLLPLLEQPEEGSDATNV